MSQDSGASIRSDDANSTKSDETAGPSNTGGSFDNPKKGILKRTSLKAQAESKDIVFPPPGHRPSPDRFPNKPSTRIPKLSVTWWEKNAVNVFGDTSDDNNTDSEHLLLDLGSGRSSIPGLRQTAILDSEEDSEGICEEGSKCEDDCRDETMSIASSNGSASSSVVGRWWTGKDTRYVPHCQKRGCTHNHGGELGEYLTPTQRRNKEMNELKKELRAALQERDEKDRHLAELRERIDEIEDLTEKQSHMSENHSLMLREKETKEAYEKEKKQIEKRHAVRVNQLVQETLTARDEIVRLNARITQLEDELNKKRIDVSTMTDISDYHQPAPLSPTAPIDPNQASVFNLHSPPPMSPGQPSPNLPSSSVIPQRLPYSSATLPSMSISMDSKISGQQMFLSQEALNHIQAYQNEAFIWRTKAAQLEIVVKDQMINSAQMEANLRSEIASVTRECETMRQRIDDPTQDGSNSFILQPSSIQVIDRITPNRQILESRHSECFVPTCIERKKNLIDENKNLLETIEDANTRIRELEEDVNSLRKEADNMEEQTEIVKIQLKEASEDISRNAAEVAAANIVINRLQSEKDTMQKAIGYMEERMLVYQKTLMDNDLTVTDETSSNWRKACTDPRYSVLVSKRVQTALTAEALSLHEDEFQSTKRKLQELHNEFTANRSDLHGRFEEIEKILITKTQLVEFLTKQLEETRRDQRTEIERHQQEREEYKISLKEIGEVAVRVPGLESRIEGLLQEKSDFEAKFRNQKEEYENGLEDALGEALKKYKQQSEYWQNKVNAVEQILDKTKKENMQIVREKEEILIKWKLDRAELEHKLTSSIDHLSLLNTQMNKSRRDVECEARPRQVSKYIACRPITKTKSTSIDKGDLFEETEERLKLCQGELVTTRRQVHVLQQKLISTMQDRTDRRLQVRKRVGCVVERPSSAEGNRDNGEDERIHTLETRNAELREKLSASEEEKSNIVRSERERIQHLVNEFDNVRKELDQEMNRYESEKKWMKSRIRNLEKDNEEMQKTLEKTEKISSIEDGNGSSDDHRELRKTLSEPDLGYDNLETAKLRADNVKLARELERVQESIERTASAASAASRRTARSQLSPAFANLADDLNTVKRDLEHILIKMDDDLPSTGNRSISSWKNPGHGDAASKVLEDVMREWDADEKEVLQRDLKRSREERDAIKLRMDRISSELNTARAELEVYRREIPSDGSKNANLKKSRSVVDLTSDVDKEEAKRWKVKAGTMFRELSSMREGYRKAQDSCRDLHIQLAMLRGELELAHCQLNDKTICLPNRSSSVISPKNSARNQYRSSSYHSSSRTEKDKVIVHESKQTFRAGSTHESVSCCIISEQPRKEQIKRGIEERTHRSRSDQRKKTASSKEEFEAMEERRRRRKSTSYYQTAPQSLSSSMTSLKVIDAGLLAKPPVCMSQSWHAQQSDDIIVIPSTIERPPTMQRDIIDQDDEIQRSNSRVISLREKVGRLNRENRMLIDEVNLMRKEIAKDQLKLEEKNVYDERLKKMEMEKDTLREQVEKLLRKIQQENADIPRLESEKKSLEDLLVLNKREKELYEKKLREMEEERKEMYLVMFKKGQQAATLNIKEEKELDQMTEDRIVLRFLHDAFYYFLMNKGDSKEHLQAIMTMLNFNQIQKDDVSRVRGKSK